MNGDFKIIYEEIKKNAAILTEVRDKQIEIVTKQSERHATNLKYMGKLDTLPCGEIKKDIKYLGIGIKVLYGIVMALLLMWVRTAIAK